MRRAGGIGTIERMVAPCASIHMSDNRLNTSFQRLDSKLKVVPFDMEESPFGYDCFLLFWRGSQPQPLGLVSCQKEKAWHFKDRFSASANLKH